MQRLSVVGQRADSRKKMTLCSSRDEIIIIHLRHASYPIQEFLKFLSLQGNFNSLRNCQRGGYVMSITPDSFVLSRVVLLILLSSLF